MTPQLPTGLEPGERTDDAVPVPAGSSCTGRPAPQCTDKRRWSSSDLLGTEKEVEIEHEGMVYRLRKTTLGKLILTK